MNGIGVNTLCGKLGGEGWMWLVIGGPGDTGTCFRKRMSREGGMKEIDRGELNRKQESDWRRTRECQGKERRDLSTFLMG